MTQEIPRLPDAPREYNPAHFNALNRILMLFFRRSSGAVAVNASTLNIDVDTLPTEADVATLRSGDVYRDSTASNVLKIKV